MLWSLLLLLLLLLMLVVVLLVMVTMVLLLLLQPIVILDRDILLAARDLGHLAIPPIVVGRGIVRGTRGQISGM